jgi:ribosome maturation factor RimP
MPDYNLVKERAEKEATPIIEALGYEVVEVSFKRVGADNHLTFFVYKKGGFTLDDCERVNEALDAPLDELDITNGAPYVLNVSSPGLDRLIVTDSDLRRNVDLELEAYFIKQWDKKKKMSGVLKEFDSETLTFETKGKVVKIERDNIKTLKQLIKFK